MYSKIVKVNGYNFRYNYADGVVEVVFRNGRKYEAADSIGLRRENWENEEARAGYLEEYADELNYIIKTELAFL